MRKVVTTIITCKDPVRTRGVAVREHMGEILEDPVQIRGVAVREHTGKVLVTDLVLRKTSLGGEEGGVLNLISTDTTKKNLTVLTGADQWAHM